MGKKSIVVDDYPLGERIRYFRSRRKLTQAQLAKKCGITQGAIAQIEKSQLTPSLETLRAISKALEVQIAVFFGGDHIHVFDMVSLRKRYVKAEQLTETIRSAIDDVIAYARELNLY